jgi:hypothetical protein
MSKTKKPEGNEFVCVADRINFDDGPCCSVTRKSR